MPTPQHRPIIKTPAKQDGHDFGCDDAGQYYEFDYRLEQIDSHAMNGDFSMAFPTLNVIRIKFEHCPLGAKT